MTKKITIREYLESINNKTLKELINNYNLKDVSIDLFFRYFEERIEKNPTSVANFILNNENSFELGLFGSRASGKDRINAYNGKSNYQGKICTLGASHSKFYG